MGFKFDEQPKRFISASRRPRLIAFCPKLKHGSQRQVVRHCFKNDRLFRRLWRCHDRTAILAGSLIQIFIKALHEWR